jgi:sigma-B regulation protein RsbU (phosphoserine phosphatase)
MGTYTLSRIHGQPALDYNAFCQCANQNSGNFYDFIPQDNSRLAVSIGDMPPAGDAASLNTSCLQALVRGLSAGSRGDVVGLARELNATLYLVGPHELCVPWFYASIDPVRRELQYVNAGHESPFLIRKRGGTVHRLERTGTALAFSAHSVHRQETTAIEGGDLLVIFSEGVAETLSGGEILDVVHANPQAGAAELTRRIFEEIERPAMGEDLTFAAVRVIEASQQPVLEERAAEDAMVCAA